MRTYARQSHFPVRTHSSALAEHQRCSAAQEDGAVTFDVYCSSRGITTELEKDMLRATAKGVTRATPAKWAEMFAKFGGKHSEEQR